ncbi:MAG: response regulator [Candidatus Dojkabacteria bacterium]|nr:response regulator [Candidatus Dojkabacteria bacterium]
MYKILVVDDEESAREMFGEILGDLSNKTDWEVSLAVDGIDALSKAEATKFDIILLDIMMPKKDGIQTLNEIKADPVKYGNPRILMLTNIGGDLAIEEALRRGAVGYRLKNDTEAAALIKTVEEEIIKLNSGEPDNSAQEALQRLQVNP